MNSYRVIPYLGLSPEDRGYLLRLADRYRDDENIFTADLALRNLTGPSVIGFLIAVRPHRAPTVELLKSRPLKDAVLNSYLGFWIMAIFMEIVGLETLEIQFAYTIRQTKVRMFDKLRPLAAQIRVDELMEEFLK